MSDVERSLGEFAQTHAAWPWAWFLLGTARFDLATAGRTSKPGPLQPAGTSYAEGAAAAVLHALDQDPTLIPAVKAVIWLVHAGHAVIDTGKALKVISRTTHAAPAPPLSVLAAQMELEAATGRLELAEDTYRRILLQAGETDTVRMLLAPITLSDARRNLREGHPERAGRLLGRYLALSGDSAVYWFETAALSVDRGEDLAANEAYFRGAGQVRDSSDRALFRGDAALIASTSELAEFDSLENDRVAPWLQFFWSSRDATDGRPLGSRLVEHRRRVYYALRHYARPIGIAVQRWRWNAADDLYGSPEEIKPGSPPAEPSVADIFGEFNHLSSPGIDAPETLFDDRGLVYIRQGEPDRKANHPGLSHWYNESWLYARPDAPIVLHFHTPTRNPPDFRLVDRWVGDPMTACQVDATYCVMAAKRSTNTLTAHDLERMRQTELGRIERARSTDAFPLSFNADIPVTVRAYALPGQNGRATLIVAAAVPQPPGAPVGNGMSTRQLPLHYRVSVVRRAGRSVLQRDTAVTGWTPAGGNSRYISALVGLQLPPGLADLTVAFYDTLGGNGALARSNGFVVPDLSSGLVVSDLVIGGPRSELRFRYDATDVPVDPIQTFAVGDTMSLFYVVGGLTPAGQTLTQLEVAHNDQKLITLTFPGQSQDSTESVLRSVQLAALRSGQYELRITVTDLTTDRMATRAQTIVIEETGHGE